MSGNVHVVSRQVFYFCALSPSSLCSFKRLFFLTGCENKSLIRRNPEKEVVQTGKISLM